MKLTLSMQEILEVARLTPDRIESGRFSYIHRSAIAALVARGLLIQTGTHPAPHGGGRLPVYKLVEKS